MIFVFDSTMPGAPVINGVAGSLATALKTLLVSGYGAGAVSTLVVADGIATATFPAPHGYYVGAISQIGGAAPASLNGLKKVLATTTYSITFDATGVPNGSASGTITHKVAGAGWSELFAGALTNVLCLKSSAPEATGGVLRIDDTGTLNARVRAYEAMPDISTGVGMMPLESQLSGGLFWPKSSAANTTARPWFLIADARAFYLCVAPAGGGRFTVLFAGDIASLKSGDAYGFALTGNHADQTNTGAVPDGCVGYSHRSARNGAFVARAHTAVGQSLAVQRIGAHHNGTAADAYAGTSGYAWGTYPNGPNNGLMTAPLELFALGLRGTFPGLLHPVQDCSSAFSNGAAVEGTGEMVGRRLLAVRVAPPAGAVTAGTVFFDTTGPWGF